MEAMKTIGWLLWLLLSVLMVFEFVGYRVMLAYFPEGKRWWHFPAQVAALAFFAAAVLCNPWR